MCRASSTSGSSVSFCAASGTSCQVDLECLNRNPGVVDVLGVVDSCIALIAPGKLTSAAQ